MLTRPWVSSPPPCCSCGPRACGQTRGRDGARHRRTPPERVGIADLKAAAPQTRNAAAYEIAGLGPVAAPAVPALIEALDDSEATVRFPVTVALGEIGPPAAAAVPRLKQMMEEEINDEIAAVGQARLCADSAVGGHRVVEPRRGGPDRDPR